MSHAAIEPLFRTQKKCIRIIFGDRESYVDKFKTCARTRPIECVIDADDTTSMHVIPCKQCLSRKPLKLKEARPLRCQVLGAKHHAKESTKPLFRKFSLSTVHNLYRLRTIIELFKILKYRVPISLHSLFHLSERRDCRFITPTPSNNFSYKAPWLWNKFKESEKTIDFSLTSCSSLKSRLIKSLNNAQNRGTDDWNHENFTVFGS